MKNDKELLSIIIPVYNVEKYLEQCLESVVTQTYLNIEVILVDDGSTDQSGNICDKYADKYSFVSVYHKNNGGLSSARNYGIERASGKYIGFVDSDDWVASNMFEILIENAEKYEADISMCNYCLFYSEQKQINREIEEKKTEIYIGQEATIRLYTEFSAWNKIYKKDLFQTIRYPEGKLYEDARTTYRLADLINVAVICPLPLYYYRQRNTGIMGTFSCENYIDRVRVWNEIYDYEKNRFSDEELKKILLRKNRLAIELLKMMIIKKQIFKNKEVVVEIVSNLENLKWTSRGFTIKEKCVAHFCKWYINIWS